MAIIDHLRSKIKGSRDESIVQAIEAKKTEKVRTKSVLAINSTTGAAAQTQFRRMGGWVSGVWAARKC